MKVRSVCKEPCALSTDDDYHIEVAIKPLACCVFLLVCDSVLIRLRVHIMLVCDSCLCVCVGVLVCADHHQNIHSIGVCVNRNVQIYTCSQLPSTRRLEYLFGEKCNAAWLFHIVILHTRFKN